MENVVCFALVLVLFLLPLPEPAAPTDNTEDNPLTIRQWHDMLQTAFGGVSGIEPVHLAVCPEMKICWGALYETLFQSAGVEIPRYELYPGGGLLNSWTNSLRMASEMELCEMGADPWETVTYGEAVKVLDEFRAKKHLRKTFPALLRKERITVNFHARCNPHGEAG